MEASNNDFLLHNKIARDLYHQVAGKLPLVDYHNHLNPDAMASNKRFNNITDLWIHDDQYKHRLMRINGIEEKYITGAATDKDKFFAWMRTFPKTIGNPLYHWSQLEIKNIFGSHINLFTDTPEVIWAACNEQLGPQGISAVDVLKKWNSEILCTSDDLLDNLEPHKNFTHSGDISALPSLRSDSILAFETPGYLNWLAKLKQLTNKQINNWTDYEEAVKLRLDVFEAAKCSLSDHALDSGFTFVLPAPGQAEALFATVLNGGALNPDELVLLKSHTLKFLGTEYGKRKLTMQLHIGAQRSTSSRLKGIAGKFGGFATMGNPVHIESLTRFLDTLEVSGSLPRTILYTLNPADNDRIGTLTGSFAEDGVRGKIQFGPAWWFNDHYDGITKQLTAVSSFGLLHTFIGMTSDSRSFMSLSRHYYFRRILCRLLGSWVEEGLLTNNFETLAELVTNVAYTNAKNLITQGNI